MLQSGPPSRVGRMMLAPVTLLPLREFTPGMMGLVLTGTIRSLAIGVQGDDSTFVVVISPEGDNYRAVCWDTREMGSAPNAMPLEHPTILFDIETLVASYDFGMFEVILSASDPMLMLPNQRGFGGSLWINLTTFRISSGPSRVDARARCWTVTIPSVLEANRREVIFEVTCQVAP